jgi:cellulose synthase/poly-beta-1,6-N-acetylglucosamine synthase-like glycosyltransferase
MISIIIRTLNESKHLKKTLEILSYQSIDNEVIVVDSNSKDDTAKIAMDHCYPTTDNFLMKLLNDFDDDRIAGVYARQLPVEESNILDKRNLNIIFRSEKLSQKTDSFFNNAASMFRKEIWEKIKFREDVTAWEDIIWANSVQNAGYEIVYDPNAIVYHYHNEPIERTLKRYEKEYDVLKRFNDGEI